MNNDFADKILLKSSGSSRKVIVASIAVGAAIVAAIALSLSSPSLATLTMNTNTSDVDLTIVGLNTGYKVGEPVKFGVKANGMSMNACNDDVPSVSILQDSTGEKVWSSYPFVVNLADRCTEPEEVNSVWQFGNENATHRGENGMIVINETGSYTILASYDGVTTEEKITITE